jgi:hypothetical protein
MMSDGATRWCPIHGDDDDAGRHIATREKNADIFLSGQHSPIPYVRTNAVILFSSSVSPIERITRPMGGGPRRLVTIYYRRSINMLPMSIDTDAREFGGIHIVCRWHYIALDDACFPPTTPSMARKLYTSTLIDRRSIAVVLVDPLAPLVAMKGERQCGAWYVAHFVAVVDSSESTTWRAPPLFYFL